MSAAGWTLAITGACAVLTWGSFIARSMWSAKSRWDDTLSRLRSMDERLGALAEHMQNTDRRLERHLDWHNGYPRPRR